MILPIVESNYLPDQYLVIKEQSLSALLKLFETEKWLLEGFSRTRAYEMQWASKNRLDSNEGKRVRDGKFQFVHQF